MKTHLKGTSSSSVPWRLARKFTSLPRGSSPGTSKLVILQGRAMLGFHRGGEKPLPQLWSHFFWIAEQLCLSQSPIFSWSTFSLRFTYLYIGAQACLMNQTGSKQYVSHAFHYPCLRRNKRKTPSFWWLSLWVTLTRLRCPRAGSNTSLEVAVNILSEMWLTFKSLRRLWEKQIILCNVGGPLKAVRGKTEVP